MSYYYEKIRHLISKHKEKKPLEDHYKDQAIKILNTLFDPRHNGFLLLQDLETHLQIYSNDIELEVKTINNTKRPLIVDKKDSYMASEKNIISNLKKKMFFYKSLRLRAIILDIVDNDYISDIQTFYKPEKWIYDVINEIDETFDGINCKNEFVYYFADVILKTFMCKNKKFGYNGNQLMINLIVYERHFRCDISKCKNKLSIHFNVGRCMGLEELEKIIEEYDNRNK